MIKSEYLTKLLMHHGSAAYGISTLRGQPKNTRKIVKEFIDNNLSSKGRILLELGHLANLRDFDVQFDVWLEKKFKGLEYRLSKTKDYEPFGIARKCINIYLRRIFSDKTLYDANKVAFKKLHRLLHVPLDKLTMSNIKLNAQDDSIKLTTSIASLNKDKYEKFQEMAKIQAAYMLPKGFRQRVNLDYVYYGAGNNK